jgi:hypothetical protein
MALRKEPERRYGSVEQLADDIRRYLGHWPVNARPDTTWYRIRKHVRRHWVGLLAAAVAVGGVCLGAGVAVYQARQARREFNQVRYLANRFLFDFHDQIANTPGTLKAREMIVSTALEYLNRLAGESAGDLGLQWDVAVAYAKVAAAQGSPVSPSLSRFHDALASYEKALSIARPLADRNRLNGAQQEGLINLLCDTEVLYRYMKVYDTAARLGRSSDEERWTTGIGASAAAERDRHDH